MRHSSCVIHCFTESSCSTQSICWERRDLMNAVSGRITGGAGSSDPPNYYLFSQAGDREACQVACENEPDCHAYAFFHSSFPGYAGMCYGISESLAARNGQQGVDSGYKEPCPNE